MSEIPPPQPDIYGHLTGKKRVAIVALGAISGVCVALLFSAFSGHPAPTWEIFLGALGGALLGFSASLGEVRRKKSPPDQEPPTPRGE
jgi:hypothetical protein